jgi:geranylgeranyl pyrophosphate synthase
MLSLPHEILGALEQIRSQLKRIGDGVEPAQLRESVRHYLQLPGKLLRPILALTLSYSLDRRSLLNPKILQTAVLVELLHVVSLLQDDVMDRHETRRGIKTPRALYGDCASILASDWLIAESVKRAAQLGPEVVEYLASVAQRLSAGQAFDLLGDRKKAAELKTAPLIEAALVLPALLLNRQDVLEVVRRLGERLGVLYQYSDDMRDEGVLQGDVSRIVVEVEELVGRLRELVGEALAPFERLVRFIVREALSGSITVLARLL